MSAVHPTVLSARRAYVYPVDGIRLSVLCTTVIQDELRRAFSFQAAAVAPPPQIFGELPPTSPPGLVLEVGELKMGHNVVPIRAMMFNARQVIVDVAAPSSSIDRVKRKLDRVIARFKAPDGQPVLSAASGSLDQSDMVFEADFPLSIGLSPEVWQALTSIVPSDQTPVGGLLLRGVSGDIFSDIRMAYSLEPRADTNLSDHRWFSSTPLNTEEHTTYLSRLVAALTVSRIKRSSAPVSPRASHAARRAVRTKNEP
jgi:hypothetical protein